MAKENLKDWKGSKTPSDPSGPDFGRIDHDEIESNRHTGTYEGSTGTTSGNLTEPMDRDDLEVERETMTGRDQNVEH